MDYQCIKPFALKSDYYANNHTNENWTNANLKSLYNGSMTLWILDYGTKFFFNRHINLILVEAWEAFIIFDRNVINFFFNKVTSSRISWIFYQ